jgi:predicted nucleotidyltransferase
MRLTTQQIETIKSTTEKTVMDVMGGGFVGVTLFGSRVDDTKRGGDIDLMVTTNQPVENPARMISKVWTSLQIALGEQKIDLLLDAPNLEHQAIHQVAMREGIRL